MPRSPHLALALALAAACGRAPAGPHSPGAAAARADAGTSASGDAAPADARPPIDAGPSGPVDAAPAVPPAPGDGLVFRRPDGTCWYHRPITCPANTDCAPPPHRQVACPPAPAD
jgi:hypothetical protein